MTTTTEYLSVADLAERAKAAAEGFTQQQIAEALGVDQAAVSRAFRGDPAYVRILIRWIERTQPVRAATAPNKRGEPEPMRFYRLDSTEG